MFKYEDDGICMAEDSDALQEITDISQVQGDWWVLKGQNCGQDEIWRGEYFSLLEEKNQLPKGAFFMTYFFIYCVAQQCCPSGNRPETPRKILLHTV